MDYKIVQFSANQDDEGSNVVNYCQKELNKLINEHIKKGYKPVGGISVTSLRFDKEISLGRIVQDMKYTVSQAMLKE